MFLSPPVLAVVVAVLLFANKGHNSRIIYCNRKRKWKIITMWKYQHIFYAWEDHFISYEISNNNQPLPLTHIWPAPTSYRYPPASRCRDRTPSLSGEVGLPRLLQTPILSNIDSHKDTMTISLVPTTIANHWLLINRKTIAEGERRSEDHIKYYSLFMKQRDHQLTTIQKQTV